MEVICIYYLPLYESVQLCGTRHIVACFERKVVGALVTQFMNGSHRKFFACTTNQS